MQSAGRAKARAKAPKAQNFLLHKDKAMLLDNFFAMVAESMESNSNSNSNSTSTINSHREATTMSTTTTANSNSNAKASKRNAKAKAHKEAHNSHKEASNATTPTLPDALPAVANAGISAKGLEQDSATSLLFQYHIRKGLEAYGGTCTICQLYNFLRGDNPLRLEKDGTPKVDGLPRWRGLGSSKLFRANTQGTLLEYSNKVCANGRIRSIVKAVSYTHLTLPTILRV